MSNDMSEGLWGVPGPSSQRGGGRCPWTSRMMLAAWRHCGGREGVCLCLFFVLLLGGEVPTPPRGLLVGFSCCHGGDRHGGEHDVVMVVTAVMTVANGDDDYDDNDNSGGGCNG
jgi:hypothetical protein